MNIEDSNNVCDFFWCPKKDGKAQDPWLPGTVETEVSIKVNSPKKKGH